MEACALMQSVNIRGNSFHGEGAEAFVSYNPYSYQESCRTVDSYLRESEGHLFRQLYQLEEYLSWAVPAKFLADAVVIVNGSDGRLENTPVACRLSPISLTVIGRTRENMAGIVLEVSKVERSLRDFRVLDLLIEEKLFDPDDGNLCLSGYRGVSRRPWPDTILDGICILGEMGIFDAARRRVFEEWEIPAIRKELKRNLIRFLGIAKSGCRKDTRHFDLETGDLFFDPQRYVRGLKYGPIRAVQLLLTLRRLVNGFDADEGLRTGSIQKLAVLYPDETDVMLSYKKALGIYHHQQHMRCCGGTGHIRVAPSELQSISETIASFVDIEFHRIVDRNGRSAPVK